MDFRIMIEPQEGASYAQQLKVAQTAESAGFGAFFRSDHILSMSGDGLPGPTETWTTLAAIARETSTIRLGSMVTSATFRHPGMLAIQVAQADDMSGGRVEFGFGAGWFAAEHEAYGIPFTGTPERFDRLEEQLEVITGLWSTPPGERYSFSGTHYQLTDSPALPKPVQSPLPVIIGGVGRKRTPALAARYAAEFNVPFKSPEVIRQAYGDVRNACEAIGRDPETMTWSVALTAAIGRDDAEVARRASNIGQDAGVLASEQLAGTPDRVLERLGQFADLGASRVYLQILDLNDLEHIEFAGALIDQAI
jgi:alkanesulfonate monooxygenase